jgi:hypothetical protein
MDYQKLKAVGVVATLVLGGVLIAFLLVEFPRLPLKEGSTLHYTISGSVDNATMNAQLDGTMDFRFGEFSRYGYSYEGSGEGYYHGVQMMSIVPIYTNGLLPQGMIVDYREVDTSLGSKAVASYLMPYDDHLVLAEVGVESSILYHMVVSCPDYHYSVSLIEANNTSLQIFDEPLKLKKVVTLNHPKPEPNVWQCSGGDDGGDYEGYAFAFGSVEIRDGQNLKYCLRGNRTAALFFSEDDIRTLEVTGLFFFNTTISRMSGDPGCYDSPVPPGIYWYIISMRASGWAEEYWGIQTASHEVR